MYSVLLYGWFRSTVFSITIPNHYFTVMFHTVSFQLIFQEFCGLYHACVLHLLLGKWGLCYAVVPFVSQHHHYHCDLGNRKKCCCLWTLKVELHTPCRFSGGLASGSDKFAHLIGLLFMIEVHGLKCVVCQYSTWCVPHLYVFVCRGRKVVQKPKAMRI